MGGCWPGSESTRLTGLIAAYGASALPYFYLYRNWTRFPDDGNALTRLLVVAGAARFLLLLLPPLLSEDLWRYLWDGHAQWEGVNPYFHAPSSGAADVLVTSPELESIRSRIGHAHIPTIYPPAAQALFGAATVGGPSQIVMRLVMIGADLLVVVGLWRWARARKTAPQVALLYGFAPVAIAESAIGGHVDALGVATLVLAGSALATGKWGRAGLALGISIGTKILPILALPTLLFRHRKAVVVSLIGCVLICLPYMEAGQDLLKGLQSYGHRWRANDGAFALLLTSFEQYWPTSSTPLVFEQDVVAFLRRLVGPAKGALPTQIWPDELAFAATKLVVGMLFGLVVLRQLWRARTLEGFFGPVVVTLMLLSPVVHPWYLLWGLPFALLALARHTTKSTPSKGLHENGEWDEAGASDGSRIWAKPYLLWTTLVFLAYVPRPHYLETGNWIVDPQLRVLEYAPIWVFLGVSLVLRLRARRPKSGGHSSP